MNSTFMGLAIATRGLYSSQAGLAVTTNNISNSNTTGYSRQTVNQVAAGPAAIYSPTATIGGGSEVKSIDRVRDPRLDQMYWQANGALGEWQAKSDTLTEIESVLGEPSDNGFSTVMNNFSSALESLSEAAGDASARANVVETGNALCQYLNDAANRLTTLRADVNASVKTTVDQINSYASQIAALNAQIGQAWAVGASVNDLEDARDNLIDKLSGLANVTVNETAAGPGPDGTTNKILSISINGAMLVNGSNARQLETYQTADGMYGIEWQDTKDAFDPGSGGQIKAYLDLRDGTGIGSAYKGIPYYQSQLDDFARTFAEAFNEGVYKDGTQYYPGHAGGYGADGSTGIRFFTYSGVSTADFMASGSDMAARYANITAANISLSQDVAGDPEKIAAASNSGEADNNENVNDLIAMFQDSRMFNKGTPDDFMNSIIAALGTGSAFAQNLANNKNSIVKSINDRRSSVSGVSTNEETANMTKYQQAYNASAEMITVWQKIYETTIDLLGTTSS